MRSQLYILITPAVAFGYVVAAASSTERPSGSIEVEVFPGDKRIFAGDLSDIKDQVLAINPDYAFNSTEDISDRPIGTTNTIFSPNCWDLNNHGAARGDAAALINDLQVWSTAYWVAARSCVRMQCYGQSYLHSGVALCNDNNWAIEPNSRYLATYIQGIYDYCSGGDRFAGQLFDTDKHSLLKTVDSQS